MLTRIENFKKKKYLILTEIMDSIYAKNQQYYRGKINIIDKTFDKISHKFPLKGKQSTRVLGVHIV